MGRFKIVIPAPGHPSDLLAGRGVRLFVGGVEVSGLESLSYETNIAVDDVIRSRITLTVCDVVELCEEKAAPPDHAGPLSGRAP